MSVHLDRTAGAVVGAVLCGGASRRMGRDKAALPIDGVPMARRVADVLARAGCEPVVAVGGDAGVLHEVGLAVVPDEYPGAGPLGGLITALHQFRDAAVVVVVACDLPWLGADSVTMVLGSMRPDDLAVIGRTDRVQPLVGAWRPSACAALDEAFATGERRLRAVLGVVGAVFVDLPAAELTNVNTPDDLRQ